MDYGRSLGFTDSIETPKIPTGPTDAIRHLELIIRNRKFKNLLLIGSSLGGCYSTYLSVMLGAPTLLIKPAVDPFKYWTKYIGQHKNYHTDDIHTVSRKDVQEPKELYIPKKSSLDNFLAFVQKGDQTLDCRLAVKAYGKKNCIIR